ncbi:MAG TPA: IPExxxVDY family protein [Bacteroidales bacterium]|nr:IPExxxVDY family protein [Bacteroidales bacterium]
MKQTQKLITLPDSDFYLIGIASHENDYRLAWAINATLNINLTKGPDVIIFHEKYKQEINLSYFHQEFAEQGFSVKLVANRGDNFILLDEFRNIDYLFKIEGESAAKRQPDILKNLKSIEIIMGVYPLDIKNIKKIQKISF